MNPVEVILRKYDNKFIAAQQGYFVLRSTPEIQEKSLVIGLIDLKRYRFKDYVLEDLLRKLNGPIGVPLFCFNTPFDRLICDCGIIWNPRVAVNFAPEMVLVTSVPPFLTLVETETALAAVETP